LVYLDIFFGDAGVDSELAKFVLRAVDEQPVHAPLHVVACRVARVEVTDDHLAAFSRMLPHLGDERSSEFIVEIIEEPRAPDEVVPLLASEAEDIRAFPAEVHELCIRLGDLLRVVNCFWLNVHAVDKRAVRKLARAVN
jgi:hypothetical protein